MYERRHLERELSDLGLTSERSGEVIGEDTRHKVANSLAVPFRWICRVVATQANGDSSVGTGVLIGPRHVLTCAHVIYPVDDNGRPRFRTRSIEVFPAENGGEEPLGGFRANGWTVHRQWFAGQEVNCTFDYGLIRLKDDIGAETFRALRGRPLGFWGSPTDGHGTRFARVDPATLVNQTVTLAGYPYRKGLNELAARVMKEGSGRITGSALLNRCTEKRFVGRFLPRVEPTWRVLLHDTDTSPAQSGCPVWTRDGQGRLDLIGLHQGQLKSSTPVNGATTVNLALRITREFLRQVELWRSTFVEG
ncbi:trypsin-like serine peptidase [Deinococcus radiopugnans]|uniref:trypsin-like serine peptidase n=1 Tax=Deinococcus radiopugnans TaxID=57497 RepID=UPI000690C7E1|nr:trypsin-like peptidase domain-containing protein [Deinococcus radiopugnans]